jgi:hypothetical protein
MHHVLSSNCDKMRIMENVLGDYVDGSLELFLDLI